MFVIPVFIACTPEEPPRPPPNFVFVLIDTLRVDRLSAYGHKRDTTPFISELAEQGLRFRRSIAQAPWTGASMASIWTSRLPAEVGGIVLPDEHGVKYLANTDLAPLFAEARTLAQLLTRSGYETIAVVSNPYAGPSLDLLRGFRRQVRKRADA